MVASKNRGIDYFPRGANEVAAEAKDNPDLAIEPKLLLVYPRDFRFYLSKNNASLKATLETALAAAEKSGLQQKLVTEFFGPAIAGLNLDKRIKIELKNPAN
jgi:ABC-type amino acid transport substrate-binding protein